jgi:hypothetical protein
MSHERNLGVTEAGLGLAVIICLLVVFGFVILDHLAGSRQAPSVEVLQEVSPDPRPASTGEFETADEQPQVLTIESSAPPGHALRKSAELELR